MRMPITGAGCHLRLAAGFALAGSLLAVAPFTPAFAQSTTPASPATGILRGQVWNDLNANGRIDSGEPGVAGVRVVFAGPQGSPNAVRSTRTGRDGNYSFHKIPVLTEPGSEDAYAVFVALPSGFAGFTKPGADHTVGMVLENADLSPEVRKELPAGTRPAFAFVGIAAGDKNHRANAGVVKADQGPPAPPKKGTVQGRIWNDADHDGVMDKTEKGIRGVTVVLSGSHDGTHKPHAVRTTTDKDGFYAFRDLGASKVDHAYAVYVATPPRSDWWMVEDGKDHDFSAINYQDVPAAPRKLLPANTTIGAANIDVVAGKASVLNGGMYRHPDDDHTPTLPTTGVSAPGIAAGGGGLVLGGLLLTLFTRRRRTA